MNTRCRLSQDDRAVLESWRDREVFGVFEVIARKGDRLTLVPAYVLARLASACPETVDAVYRLVLGRPEFEWVADGDALLRLRKPE